MNREEAIKELESYAVASWGDLNEVFNMAIAALRDQEGKDTNVPTNADRIRAMSDEELAKLLCCTGWRMIEQKECLEWLQQTAEADGHA